MKIGKARIVYYTLLSIILISAIYFRYNAASVYSFIGDFYVKNNMAQKGLEYYKKSVNLGNKDSKFREKYVNTLINQPLTIDSQKMLVEIAEGEKQDGASATAEYFLYNLKREIHNKYPLNYIKQAPFNRKIIHWGEIPITYSFKNQNYVPAEFVNAVNSAFDEWERASSCRIKFKRIFGGNSDITVVFVSEEHNSKENDDDKHVVAYTTPVIAQNKLKNMIIRFNILDIDGKNYSQIQIYNTALHEIFHALGFMGHSYNDGNIMYMSKNKESVIYNTKVELNDADKSTLELLYKIQPDITNADKLNYDYVPYLVLGDKEDVNYSKINEAKNYIRKAPTIPMGYIDLAEGLLAQKKYSEAIGNLEKALRLARNDEIRSMVYYNLAVSHYYITNYDLALDYLNKACEIKDSDDLHYLRAEIYLKKQNKKETEKEYKYLIKNNPDNDDYIVLLANLYVKNYNYLKARKVLKDFIKKNPSQKNNPKFQTYRILLF